MEHNTGGLSWTLEPTHFPAPPTRWTELLFCDRQTAAIKELCLDYGLILDGIAFRVFDGRVYLAIVPMGGKVRKPPPTFLVPLLCKVVPELRRRIAQLRRSLARDQGKVIIEGWLNGGEAKMLARGRALLDTPLSADDAQLAGAIEAAFALAEDGVMEHFRLHAGAVMELARLGRELVVERGWSDAEFAALFTGLSDTSTGPGHAQAAIAELITAAGGAEALAKAADLDDVRAISPEVASAVDAYVHDWGQRAIRYEIAYPVVAEKPEWLLRALREQAGTAAGRGTREASHADTRAAAEARLVADLGDTPETRDRLARARRTFPVREGNETATIGMPLAALRRLGLEAGRRLVGRGRLEEVDDVFLLELDELRQALTGSGDLKSAAAARRAERQAAAQREAPLQLGPPAPGPPDLTGFPAEMKEMVESLLWYTTKVTGSDGSGVSVATPPAEGPLRGEGVAGGTYEGPARIVLDESGFDRIRAGDVLVCPITSPVWSLVFPLIGALVCDVGGVMSHPAIIAREFGIPGVVNTGTATTSIPDGQLVRVDGNAGTVTLVDEAALAH